MVDVIVGFTGNRLGMTDAQRGVVTSFLRAWHVLAFVHGDCIGSDEQADTVACELGIARVLRPCTLEKLRAHCERHRGNLLKIYKPEEPLMRNAKIVDDAHIILATPYGPETQRSGTWATIRLARKAKKHIIIVFPSGQMRHEGVYG